MSSKRLPKIKLPTFKMTLPVSGDEVTYHPFTVKEEKMMLMAQESKDFNESINATKQVINNCLIDYEIEDMALGDVAYCLVSLRSKSVNDKVQFTIKDSETEEEVKLTLDLSTISYHKDPEHTDIVQGEGYKIIMRYPTLDDFAEMLRNPDNKQVEFNILLGCIDKLVNDDGEVYTFDDFTDEEVSEFVDGLPGDVLEDMKKFFVTMPETRFEVPYKRPSDGVERVFVIQGIRSFFI